MKPLLPVNDFDLDGTFSIKKAWRWVGKNADTIGAVTAAVGLGVCIVATAGVCGVAAAAVTGIGAVGAVAQTRYQGGSWIKAGGAGVVSLATSKATKPLQAVKWFGQGRNYKSLAKAISTKAGQGRARASAGRTLQGLGLGFVSQTGYNIGSNPKKTYQTVKSKLKRWFR